MRFGRCNPDFVYFSTFTLHALRSPLSLVWYLSIDQGRPGGQWYTSIPEKNSPKFIQIYPKLVKALYTVYLKLVVSEASTYLVVLPFQHSAYKKQTCIIHYAFNYKLSVSQSTVARTVITFSRQQITRKVTCQVEQKDSWLIRNLNPHSSRQLGFVGFLERPIAEWLKNVKKEVAVMFTVRVSINKLYLIPKASPFICLCFQKINENYIVCSSQPGFLATIFKLKLWCKN